jgi:excisionase family DNA binding protein
MNHTFLKVASWIPVSGGPGSWYGVTVEGRMNVGEAAKRLEVSTSMVYALCSSGRLPHVRVGLGRGTIRISEDDLKAFLESCRSAGPAPRAALKHIKVQGGPPLRRP